jgi:hypothetical protein
LFAEKLSVVATRMATVNLIIAATAEEFALELATRRVRHFAMFRGLPSLRATMPNGSVRRRRIRTLTRTL